MAYAYLVLTKESCVIFVNKEKAGDDVKKAWEEVGVESRDYGVEQVGEYVKEVAKSLRKENEKKQVRVFAPKECSWALSQASSPVSLKCSSPLMLTRSSRQRSRLSRVRSISPKGSRTRQR